MTRDFISTLLTYFPVVCILLTLNCHLLQESISCICLMSPTLQTCAEITDKLADPSLSTSLVALPSKCIFPVLPLFTIQLLLPRFSSLSSGLCQWPPNPSPSSCPYQPFVNMPVKTQLWSCHSWTQNPQNSTPPIVGTLVVNRPVITSLTSAVLAHSGLATQLLCSSL